MARGGKAKEREEAERRCVVTGERGGKAGLVRFVLDPEGVVTPDVAEKLPGRGVWVTADAALVAKAAARGGFARGFKGPAKAPPQLAERVESLLAKRAVERLALARKAGLAVCGFERAKAAAPTAAAIFLASDGSEDGKSKMRRLAEGAPTAEILTKAELGLAFGRDYVIHVALAAGNLTSLLLRDASRLQGFRAAASTARTGGAGAVSEGRGGQEGALSE